MKKFLIEVKLLLMLLCVDQLLNAQQISFSGSNGTIPNNSSWKNFPCIVSGLPKSKINNLYGLEKITLNITHPNVSDLEVHLVAPDGTDVILFNNVGGTGNNFTNTALKKTYTTPIAAGTAPFTGNYLPQGDMGLFNNNQNSSGTWNLRIRDNIPFFNSGSVVSWELRFGDAPALYDIRNFSSNLPILKIETNGQTILDNPKIPVDFYVIDNGPGQLNYDTNTFYAFTHRIGIEYRGSSSQGAPKKPFGFETWDTNDVDVDTSFLGFPPQSDWILSPSFFDKTLMRNVLSYEIFNRMGHYASRTRYCELILNGEYQGVYVLMEKIKRDKNRVDIAKLTSTDTAGADVTGGYIYKIDKFTGSGGAGFNSNYPPSNPAGDVIFYQYEYPSQDSIQPSQIAYLQSYVDSFESALFGPDFQDMQLGFRRYAGERTFIDYMLLNEMSKNVDGYRLSTYFHKDKSGKIKAGPAWDYDITWKNADYCQAEIDTGWAYNLSYVCQGAAVPAHWERMLQDPLFRARVKCRWQSLRTRFLDKDSLVDFIDATVSLLHTAQQRNFLRWPYLGEATWPEPQPLPQSYEEEIQRLKDWIVSRFAWMDAQIGNYETERLQPDLGPDSSLCDQSLLIADAGVYKGYIWSTGNTQPAIQINQSGSYSVTVNDEFGCTGNDTLNVEFLPLPVKNLTDSVYVCEGQSATLNAGVQPVYSWSTGDTVQIVHVFDSGLYTVTLTGYNKCSVTDSSVVIHQSLPDASFTYNLTGGLSVQFLSGNTSVNGGWDFGDGKISLQESPLHTYSAPGIYVVAHTVVDSNGCESVFADTINLLPSSVFDYAGTPVLIFPNPAKEVLHVSGITSANCSMNIIDAYGNVVKTLVSSLPCTVPIEILPSGVYTIQINCGDKQMMKLFIKE